MSEIIKNPENFPTINSYQEWVRDDWIYPHGSDSAQLHTRAKNEEEIDELRDAIMNAISDDIEQELGDVLWTATGTSDNAGITVADALNYTYPWIFTDPLVISNSEIDLAVVQNARDFTPSQIDDLLLELKHQLGKNATQWHFLKPILDDSDQRSFADVWVKLKENHAKEALADTVLLVSYIAQKLLGKSLEEIMMTNHKKLSKRLATGQPVTKIPL